MLFYNLKIVI